MKKLIFGILVLVLSLMVSHVSQAIELSYLSGEVYAGAGVSSSLLETPTNDSGEIYQSNHSTTYANANSAYTPGVPYPGYASASASASVLPTNSGGYGINLSGSAYNSILLPVYAGAGANLFTVSPDGHYGFLYFQVIAAQGDTSTSGQIAYSLYSSCDAFLRYGSIWQSLVITRNGVSEITTPAKPDEQFGSNKFSPMLPGDGVFDVDVGDVIGFEFYFSIYIQPETPLGYGEGYINASFEADLIPISIPGPVPLPPTVFLLGSGLLGLVGCRRLRKG